MDIGDIKCPSCRRRMSPVKMHCAECSISIEGTFTPSPLSMLSAEDQALAMAFIRSYGSIKQLQDTLGVSYPTARTKLDKLVSALNRTMEAEIKPDQTLNRLAKGEITFDEALRSL